MENIMLTQNKSETPATLPKLALTIPEAAHVLSCSRISVYRLLNRGLLKSSSALRHKLIPVSEIERFLKATLK